MIKSTIRSIFFSCLMLFISQHLNAQTPTDIFLMIGQSNMAGSSPIDDLDTVTLRNVYLFNDRGGWELAKNSSTEGINRYSTTRSKANPQLSLGYNFAKKLSEYTGRRIGLVSNARGGTAISWWQKGYTGPNDFDLYEQALIRIKAALAATPGATLKGIIWHQGEGDNSKSASPMYMVRLKQLMQDLRADLGDANIPVVVGEVGKWNNRGNGVNPLIRTVEDHISKSAWVSSDGLTSRDLEKNDPHFDNLSQRTLGGRYADKTAVLVYGLKPAGATVFSGENYEGRSILLKEGEYTALELESAGMKLSEILSVKLNKGYEIRLFRNGGKTEKINKNNPAVPKMTITSLSVRKI